MRSSQLLAPVWCWVVKGWDTIENLSDEMDQVAEGKDPFVKMLSTNDFESFVTTPDTVSGVMFISPWCFICGPLLPLWAETARMVSQGGNQETGAKIQFGVIDVLQHPEIAESNSIHSFPTFKLFVDKEVFIYTHDSAELPLSASVLVNWVNRHTNRRNVISSETQLRNFLKENHLVAVALLDDSPKSAQARDQLAHSSLHFEDVFFIEISKIELKQIFFQLVGKNQQQSLPTLAMVYDHDDKYAEFSGPFTQENIDAFIKGRRLLTVNVFQPGTIEYILDSGLPMIFLISPHQVEGPKEAYRSVAGQFLGKIVAVTVGSSEPWEQKLSELLDVRDIDAAVIRILTQRPSAHNDHDPVSQSNSIIKHGIKYKPQYDPEGPEVLTERDIKDFIEKFLSGSLSPYVRSEPEPDNPKDCYTPGSILVNAVASNFPELVTDDTQRDILVVFHAPWCGFCRRLMPTLKELGEKLSHTGKALKLVKIDATRNEVPGVQVTGYPTIVLFNAVKQRVEIEQRPAVHYEGDRSVEDLVQFLHANAINQFPDLKPNGGPSNIDDHASYSFEEL